MQLYQKKTGMPEKINLTFARKDDRLYIQNCDILMEGVENGVQMLDAVCL